MVSTNNTMKYRSKMGQNTDDTRERERESFELELELEFEFSRREGYEDKKK
jgi:hypothetical protein